MKIGKNVLVTGGAGFIGSHLVDRLTENNNVTVYDNLSSGKKKFLSQYFGKKNFSFVEADLLDMEKLKNAMKNQDFVFHLAANPDISLGTRKTDTDLRQGTIATYNVLESMRINNVKNIGFSSSSAVFGEAKIIPTPEDYGPMMPISLYGASKLACEGLITAYSDMFDMNAWIFRFANITGDRSTHGVVLDFINKLKKNPNELEILGDGKQKKSYLFVGECVDGMIFATEKSNKINIFNLGCEDWIDVKRIAEIVVEEMKLRDTKFKYTGGSKGWVGDVPLMMLSIEKIKKRGWRPKLNSEEVVRKTAKLLLKGAGWQ
ncbi:MAG: NAD-dependent epimerase/dehydratase family protein [Candidatus Thermoplasmatota archaeon]|nr:NAD-dependent epimerase/dehydratase family protein [Candidatus Thermoplasmatota archaeon]MCG2827548.1 NAD-dependent epimerase/dehydratase family protein [Thermoplasmatales archaeon]